MKKSLFKLLFKNAFVLKSLLLLLVICMCVQYTPSNKSQSAFCNASINNNQILSDTNLNSQNLCTNLHHKAFTKKNNTMLLCNNISSKKQPKTNFVFNNNSNVPKKKVAYLTFDDGPSKNTLEILKILDNYNVKATFFVTGSSIQTKGNIYKKIAKKGHTIGNHTCSHNYNEIYKSTNNFIKDFNKLQNYLGKSIGVSTKLVRLPGGSNNTISHKYGGKDIMINISRYLINNGYTYFDWNVDSTDALAKTQDKNKIINSVLGQSKNKNVIIVLMHDSVFKTTTVEALPKIIDGLSKQGFTFRTLSSEEYVTQFLRPN